jgi:predicted ferric reductase
MTAIDLSADVALVALALTTANFCLGLLMTMRYSPVRQWPHRQINVFKLHNWTAYLLLVAIVLHPVILLFSKTTHWRWMDITVPLRSPVQPTANTLGAISAYLVLVVIVTSYFRRELGRPRWRTLHYLVYASGTFIFIHALMADPKLKGNAFDPLDGEKFFVECCPADHVRGRGLGLELPNQENSTGAGGGGWAPGRVGNSGS